MSDVENSELYSIHFPGVEGEKSEHMVVESPNETSMVKMVIKHLGISISRARPREVMDIYEAGGGVVRLDENGDQIFKDGTKADAKEIDPSNA